MTMGDTNLWPDVADPLKRRILSHLYNNPTVYGDDDFLDRMDALEKQQMMLGMTDLWSSIQRSNVAQIVVGAPDTLICFKENLTTASREDFERNPPVSVEQYTDLVVDNLEWFIDPDNSPPPVFFSYGHPGKLLIAILFLITLLALLIKAIYEPIYWAALIFLMMLLIPVFIFQLRFGDPRERVYDVAMSKLGQKVRTRPATRATVLYHYLRREFSDLREDG